MVEFENELLTDKDRLNKVARDLAANRKGLAQKIEAGKLETSNDEDLLKNFDVAIAALVSAGGTLEDPTPLSSAAGNDSTTPAATAEDGTTGTDANGVPF
jgi:hypothetical protein